MKIATLCQLAHNIARSKGFWDFWRNDGEMIALMHSELTEAFEAMREHDMPMSKKIEGFTLLEEEMADLFIRAGDFCCGRELRITEAIEAKMEYNKTRPLKHGKKC